MRPALTASAVLAGLLWGTLRAAEWYVEHYVRIRTRIVK